jgi:3-phenylpropionate/cinnamic acid dioxygenase small subunit
VEEDDDRMSTLSATPDVALAAEFIALEADLLDSRDYAAWLALWVPDGKYVVPVNPDETNYEDMLNYAYDDAAMRDMRVRRLTSGESMSAANAGRTLRSVSRFRLLGQNDRGDLLVRSAQQLIEYKFNRHRTYAANVEWALRPEGESFRIVEKVVRLLNGGDALAGITFLL